MSLMELFSNPDTIHTLTFGQRMLGSLITMLIGMGITFVVLILIWIFIGIMSGFLRKEVQIRSRAARRIVSKKWAEEEAAAELAAKEAEELAHHKEELVAAITAAIAAYEGDNSKKFVIKNITRLSGGNNGWTSAGIQETMNSRNI